MEINLERKEVVILLGALATFRRLVTNHGLEATSGLEIQRITKEAGVAMSEDTEMLKAQLELAIKRKGIFDNLMKKLGPIIASYGLTDKDLMQFGIEYQ